MEEVVAGAVKWAARGVVVTVQCLDVVVELLLARGDSSRKKRRRR
ncbi:hypothetical protein AB0G79_23195 [Streptomyces sp. NPDC020807]